MPSRDLIERVRKALGDRYTVITAVGRGGNASIFGAFDQGGQKVAIKVLHPELAVSVAADRFLREIRYASQLNHPHIASSGWSTLDRKSTRLNSSHLVISYA